MIAVLVTAFGAVTFCAPGMSAQETPPLASYTTSRLLVVPAQGVTGVSPARAWLARFDSAFTMRLDDGGIGPGWAYPRDAYRYHRQNPTFIADPHALGAQGLRRATLKGGDPLGDPIGSRLRGLVAVANARFALVPVEVRVDTAVTPRRAELRLIAADAQASQVVSIHSVVATFEGDPLLAADALARAAAKLFLTIGGED